jgi:RNA polymerase sigma-54 factor
MLQLRQLPDDTPHRASALRICELFFDALARNDLDELRRRTKLSSAELGRCLELVRSLQPRPGSLISEVRPDYVIPDVLVRKRAGTWQVELNPETQPKLRVNDDYAKLIRRADDGAENACLKTHLQEARWFIKSLLSRNDTVLRVAAKIVELQRDFFDYGEEAMRPLILRDVADSLELHESTVSRVTTQKYMHTPRGTLEFKYFFSSHVGTATGGECSSTAIRAFIRKLVAAEATSKPLSDSKIAGILSEQGINVARRTVAKYREAMGIPPSNERKRL